MHLNFICDRPTCILRLPSGNYVAQEDTIYRTGLVMLADAVDWLNFWHVCLLFLSKCPSYLIRWKLSGSSPFFVSTIDLRQTTENRIHSDTANIRTALDALVHTDSHGLYCILVFHTSRTTSWIIIRIDHVPMLTSVTDPIPTQKQTLTSHETWF